MNLGYQKGRGVLGRAPWGFTLHLDYCRALCTLLKHFWKEDPKAFSIIKKKSNNYPSILKAQCWVIDSYFSDQDLNFIKEAQMREGFPFDFQEE